MLLTVPPGLVPGGHQCAWKSLMKHCTPTDKPHRMSLQVIKLVSKPKNISILYCILWYICSTTDLACINPLVPLGLVRLVSRVWNWLNICVGWDTLLFVGISNSWHTSGDCCYMYAVVAYTEAGPGASFIWELCKIMIHKTSLLAEQCA